MWKSMIVYALMAGAVWAADEMACPAKIEVQGQQLAKPAAGWTAAQVNDVRHDLWYVELYDGEPKERASLIPDISVKLKTGWTLLPQARAYWLECHYTQTTIALSRPVPAGAKTCEITYAPALHIDGQQVIKQITCK